MGDVEAVALSRSRALAAASGWCSQPLPILVAQSIRLVVSELVTNALRHAGEAGPITVTIWLTPHKNLAVLVKDGSPEPPILSQPYDDGTAGRGLAVVAAETISWSWRAENRGGKTVSATIALPGSATARRATPASQQALTS
ncbi:ATP-binding protein [Kitasatospora kazusensis]|uniref:ATP-binding protein n=1 Tax=Kitasatospora kazusensis TaxID=407974 RepID=UPI0031D0676F